MNTPLNSHALTNAHQRGSILPLGPKRPLMTLGLPTGWLAVALMTGGCSKTPV